MLFLGFASVGYLVASYLRGNLVKDFLKADFPHEACLKGCFKTKITFCAYFWSLGGQLTMNFILNLCSIFFKISWPGWLRGNLEISSLRWYEYSGGMLPSPMFNGRWNLSKGLKISYWKFIIHWKETKKI